LRKPDLKISDVADSLAAMFGVDSDSSDIENLKLLPNGMVASVYSFDVVRSGAVSGYIARFTGDNACYNRKSI